VGDGPEVVGMVAIPEGEAVIVEELGAVGLETLPAAERGVLLELGGHMNKSPDSGWSGKFLFAPGQAAELCAELSMAGQAADPNFMKELEHHLSRLGRRRG
jgi:hypothetical protein